MRKETKNFNIRGQNWKKPKMKSNEDQISVGRGHTLKVNII